VKGPICEFICSRTWWSGGGKREKHFDLTTAAKRTSALKSKQKHSNNGRSEIQTNSNLTSSANKDGNTTLNFIRTVRVEKMTFFLCFTDVPFLNNLLFEG
jgi:hypothetical protein